MVCVSHTILERPKSAILIVPIPPAPTPLINSPSSTLFSSSADFGFGFFVGIKGIGENNRFSGLISLK
jgi:hypothetical protein